MIEIKDLLSRFENILGTEEAKKEAFRKIISETIQVEIDNKDIQIKKGTIYLNIKPIYKNEILLKRNQINSKLEELLGQKSPQDIR